MTIFWKIIKFQKEGEEMGFSTISFVFYFLPVSIIVYGLTSLKKSIKYKNIVLLIMSFLFYAWCGIQYLLLLLLIVIINYLGIVKMNRSVYKRYWMFCLTVFHIVILAFFKYGNFFNDHIEKTLPLGISFYVFQMVAYVIDIYQGEEEEKSIVDYGLFIMFFPQLIEGPIVRYKEVKNELKKRCSSYEDLECGTRRFIVGFAKKILIADKLTVIVDTIFEMTEAGVPLAYAWLGIICYALVLYFDFSGYSDMAIGLCRIFGFTIKENFDHPYVAVSMQDFWRRWHISLSTWFRDYVYIPLGGSRKGNIATCRNLMIVFFLTGIWHGAGWTFIVWGIYHGVFRVFEQIGLNKLLKKVPSLISHIYTIIVVLVGWVFFRASSLEQAFVYLKSMFFVTDTSYLNLDILKLLNTTLQLL